MLTVAEIVALLAATKSALEIFDQISGQIKGVLTRQPKVPDGGNNAHRSKVCAEADHINVTRDGYTIQTLKREDLESRLTREDLDHIVTYEKSLRNFYKRWQQLYVMRDASSDALVNIRVHEQMTEQIGLMGQDLAGIVTFLESIGVQLDDHYMEVRSLVTHYRP